MWSSRPTPRVCLTRSWAIRTAPATAAFRASIQRSIRFRAFQACPGRARTVRSIFKRRRGGWARKRTRARKSRVCDWAVCAPGAGHGQELPRPLRRFDRTRPVTQSSVFSRSSVGLLVVALAGFVPACATTLQAGPSGSPGSHLPALAARSRTAQPATRTPPTGFAAHPLGPFARRVRCSRAMPTRLDSASIDSRTFPQRHPPV
jgi:hypothetical protein